MNKLTIGEIEKAVCGRLLQGNREHQIEHICTDSRKAKEGDLFIPIIGEVHDAHKFIPQVYEKGCRAILISNQDFEEACGESDIILVEDTTRAIQELAKYYLESLNLKKVAVTGSVGKTSTRDMTYYILSEKYKTGKTEGNFNNAIGVPLTIFTFDDSLEAAVLETGMDHKGEISRLADIIRPDIGIITNVGVSHIENLGSREGILEAKLELTDYFDEKNTLVINHDNDMLSEARLSGYQVLTVGTADTDDFYVHHIKDYGEEGVSYVLTYKGKQYPVDLMIPGAHNAINSALAIGGCSCLGVTIEEAVRGLSKLKLTSNRLTIRSAGSIKIIDDTYNAAPDSMKSAITTLVNTKGSRKIAILGGMNELGTESRLLHQEVGRFAAEKKVDLLITVGEKAKDIAEGAKESKTIPVEHFDTKEQLYEVLNGLLKDEDIVLVKASRFMEMEQVVERIIKK